MEMEAAAAADRSAMQLEELVNELLEIRSEFLPRTNVLSLSVQSSTKSTGTARDDSRAHHRRRNG
jgi:hypothetical protein